MRWTGPTPGREEHSCTQFSKSKCGLGPALPAPLTQTSRSQTYTALPPTPTCFFFFTGIISTLYSIFVQGHWGPSQILMLA